jgi:hypothetical protein
MFKQYTEPPKKRDWKGAWKILFLIPVALVIYMFHLDSREVRQYIQKIETEKQEFLQSFDFSVFQSGYLKKGIGFQEIYVPSIAVRVTNLSEKEYRNIRFDVHFLKDTKIFCRGAASLHRLLPWETKEVYLRCIDSAVFGSVISGLSLMETTSEISYKVSIFHEKKHATALEGVIEFNTFSP